MHLLYSGSRDLDYGIEDNRAYGLGGKLTPPSSGAPVG